jgi:hypothetical protein
LSVGNPEAIKASAVNNVRIKPGSAASRPLLNNLYRSEWRLFHKFFCPSVKLIAKERIGSKTIKQHDKPKTPCQRVMESPHISESVRLSLSKQIENLNPFLLRKTMETKLKKIFSL